MKITAERALANLGNAIKERGEPVCMTTDPEAFFPESGVHGGEFKRAVDLCKPCPVRAECAIYGIVSVEMYGIWGGLTVRTRQAVRLGRLSLKDALEGKKLPASERLY